MVPGDWLEFKESRQVAKADRALVEAVKQAYSTYPRRFTVLHGEVRKGDVVFNGKSIEFLFMQRGNKILLLAVHVGEGEFTKEELEYYLSLFSKRS
jgi:predicted LPLAT superfamily acyltransferase